MDLAILDIVIAIVLSYSLYHGFTKGLIISIASLLGLVLGVWGAIKFSGVTANYLDESYQISIPVLSFALTFLLILFVIYLIGKGLEKIVDILSLGIFNKVGGAVFSWIKMTLILSVIFTIIHQVNNVYQLLDSKHLETGFFAPYLMELEKVLLPYLQHVFQAAQEVGVNNTIAPTTP